MPKKKGELSIEERLEQSIVAKEEEPYKVPSNWVWTRLENIGALQTGTTPQTSKAEYFGNDIPFITPADITNETMIYTNRGLSLLGKEKSRVAEKNSILQVCIGGSIGKVFYTNRDVCFNQQINSITLYKSEYKYIYFLLKSDFFYHNLLKNSRGTATPIINKSTWGNLIIPLPPLEEQKRIVEKLDSLFEKIQKIKEIIEEVKEKTISRREAILSKAFSGELTEKWRGKNHTENARELLVKINDEKLKLWEDECKKAEDEGRKKPAKPKLKTIDEMLIGAEEEPYKLPNNWVWTRLGDITESFDKKRKPVSLEERNKIKNPKIYPYYGATGIIDYIDEYIFDGKYILLGEDGANLLSRSKENAFIACGKFWVNNHAHILKNKNAIIDKFFVYFYNNLDLKEYVTGSAQPKLNAVNLSKIKFILPPLEEQKEIVRVLDKVFEEENRISELISLENKIEILEKTILDRAFRGELGTGNNDDEPAIELLKKCLEER